MKFLLQKMESLNRRLYLQMLVIAIAGYYAVVRAIQDIYYRGKFGDYIADAFLGHMPNPEPLEIPLYLLGFFLIPVLALALYWFARKGIFKYLVAFLLVLAAWKFWPQVMRFELPDFSIYLDYLETKGPGKALWLLLTKRIYVLRFMVFLSVGFFLVVYLFWKDKWAELVYRYENGRVLRILEHWIPFFLAILIFHPNFSYDEHHYNFVIGTVNDTLHGKRLLYETTNQYGVLNIYFLRVIFEWFGKLSYEAFSLILFVFYYIYYLALYFFIRLWLGSRFFAYLGLVIIVAVTYFLQISPTLSAYDFPGLSPFRLGMYVLILFLIYGFWRTKNLKYRECAIILSAIAPFWNFDTGTYAALACFVSLAVYSWFGEGRMRRIGEKIKSLAILTGKFVGYGVSVFGLISSLNYLSFGEFPNWREEFNAAFVYGQGVAQNPLPFIGFFEIYIFLYLAALLHSFYQILMKKSVNLPLLFLCFYGPLAFVYFIGNSEWNLLYHVATPLVLICVYYAYHYFQKRLVFALFVSLLAFSLMVFAVKIPVELANREYGKIASFTAPKFYDPELLADGATISQKYGFLERLPILHESGTMLLIKLGKTNYFGFYDIFQMHRRSYMEEVVVKKIREEKPQYLFVDKVRNDQIEFVEAAALQDYEVTDTLKTMYVYQRKVQQ